MGKKAKTHEGFVLEILNKKPEIEIIGQYINSRTKIKVKCKVCSYVWETQANVLANTPCGCPQCAGNKNKTNTDFVFELSKLTKDIEVLGEYVNNKTPIKCRCKIHNHIWYPTPNFLLTGGGCPQCFRLRLVEKLSKTNDNFVSDLFKVNPNIISLDKYTNSKTKILVRCKVCNHEWKCVPNSLLQGEGCPKCAGNITYTQEQFMSLARDKNKYITVTGKYVNSKTKIACICNDCGKHFEVAPSSILRGYGCRNCYLLNHRGENHPNWNKNITNEERIHRRQYPEYTNWIKTVYKRDNWTCQLTGEYGHKLVAHHLDGYNWCRDKRISLNNGITLSENIHKEFHLMYGYGNNTTKQFIDFVEYKRSKQEISKKRYKHIINLLYENMEGKINEQRNVS